MACTPAGASVPHCTGCTCRLAGLDVTAGWEQSPVPSVPHVQRRQETASSRQTIFFPLSLFHSPYLYITQSPVSISFSMHCLSICLAPTAPLPSRTLFSRTSASHLTFGAGRLSAAVAKCAPQVSFSPPYSLANLLDHITQSDMPTARCSSC